jgi:hypothetical protein
MYTTHLINFNKLHVHTDNDILNTKYFILSIELHNILDIVYIHVHRFDILLLLSILLKVHTHAHAAQANHVSRAYWPWSFSFALGQEDFNPSTATSPSRRS